VVARRDADDRWTHFFDAKDEYKQLDYLLLSKSLADASEALPEIMRKGMPLAATHYTGERFVGVGEHKLIASDHCPVVMEVVIGA
jgi:hypothetical protein